jgi:hypothetical protein
VCQGGAKLETMKAIFRYLLKKYSQTERGRIEIMRIMDDKVSDNYSEQTLYGNVYNYFIEFVIANPFIVKCTLKNDKESLDILKSGIQKGFDEAVGYISKER